MKKTMYHYWDAKSKKHEGVSTSISCDVSSGGDFIHQAFDLNVPECPEPLTDAEQLEKLVELAKRYREECKSTEAPYRQFIQTQKELDSLIKEYSK